MHIFGAQWIVSRGRGVCGRVQYAVLAEIPATNPADAYSTKKFGLHQPRPSPDSPSSGSYKLLYTSYHTASSYGHHLR
jgi:hypothetical protein